MAGQVTYNSLYTLVQQQIDNSILFNNATPLGNQICATVSAPQNNSTSVMGSTSTTQLMSAIQQLLQEALPQRIISGLYVTATEPNSGVVNIAAGTGTVGGIVYELSLPVAVSIPFDNFNTVFYVNLVGNGITVNTTGFGDTQLTLAKITVPAPGVTFQVSDKNLNDNVTAYINQYQTFNLYSDQFGNLEPDSLDFFRDNIGCILANNLIGNIELSQSLQITNQQGSMCMDSCSINFFDTHADLMSRIDQTGAYYYDCTGTPLAMFSTTGACVGNIDIFPHSIQSGNFVSGPMGSGFQITDAGNAQFNNIFARGAFSTTVFQACNVSAVGGSLLVLNADTLAIPMTTCTSAVMCTCGASSFQVNDVLRMKTALNDEWFCVTGCAIGTNTYTVARDLSGNYPGGSYPTWAAGTAILDYAQNGCGGVYITASDQYAPYLSIFCNNGSPWNGTCTFARFGQLNGFLGYTNPAIGIGIGDTNRYLKYDPINGLQIKGCVTITGGTNVTQTFQQSTVPTSLDVGDLWLNTCTSQLYRAFCVGATTIGPTAWVALQGIINGCVSSAGLYLGSDYMGYYSGSAWTAFINCTGQFAFCGTGNNFLSWNGALLCLRGTLNASDLCAGTILGRTIETNTAGARVYMDTTCFVAFDGSSGLGLPVFCVDLAANVGDVWIGNAVAGNYVHWNNSAGTFSFNTTNGSCSTVICGGVICANAMCLLSTTCNCCYSFLSAGTWYFHDTLGNCSPYVKRICSGTGCTGSQVVLCGWTSSPSVLVTINSLLSYNSSYSNQCQQWNIYADAPVCFTTSSTCFGYCFGIHAQLLLAAATAAQCVQNVSFGTCVCTNLNSCQTCVDMKFLLWCNPACANYCYGTLCYAICYRMLCCSPAGAWCACCFCYVQPHANLSQIQTLADDCHNVSFGTSCQWQLMACQVTLTYTDSGITSGGTGTCCVSVAQTAASCTENCTIVCVTGCTGHAFSGSITFTPNFTPAGCGGGWTLYSTVNGSTPTYSGFIYVCNGAGTYGLICCACANFNGTGTGIVTFAGGCCVGVSGSGWNSGSWLVCNNASGVASDANQGVCWCICSGCCSRTLCYCCTYCTGSAGGCVSETLYGSTDTLTTQTILDPNGCLNWLATAYL